MTKDITPNQAGAPNDANADADEQLEAEAQTGYVRNATFPSCAVYDVRVSDGMLRVLAALGTHATQFNRHQVYAQQKTIAKRLGMTRQALGRHILALESLGYIAVRRVENRDGGQGTNRIKMIMDIEVSDQHMRQVAPRSRRGIGGRPKKTVINATCYEAENLDSTRARDETPVNSEFTGGVKLPVDGAETQLVSGGETQLVSGGETQLVSGGETQLVSGGHRGSPAANAEDLGAGGMSLGAISAAHQDLLSGSLTRKEDQERGAHALARSSPARAKKTPAEAEAEPRNMAPTPQDALQPRLVRTYLTLPAESPVHATPQIYDAPFSESQSVMVPPRIAAPSSDAQTTLGAKEARGVWRDVVNEIHVNVTIKVWYFERARLYRLADGGWLLLGHNFMAESQLKRFYSGIELLLRRHTKGQVVRLTIRDQAEVRAAEEVLV